MRPLPDTDYLPLEDYGAIGNLRTVALVGRNGSIDWCCLPDLDSASVFAALLDHRRGGRFRVAPFEARGSEQRYLERTNVLETTFEAEGGRCTVTDFLPLHGPIIGAGDPDTRPAIHRIVRCEEGEVEIEVEWAPGLDFARTPTQIKQTGVGFVATAGGERIALGGLPSGGDVIEDGAGRPFVRARFRLGAGERVALLARHGAGDAPTSLEDATDALDRTTSTWRGWVEYGESGDALAWAGEWSDLVVRSALALKLLTHPDTGAIAAAATTSLPEVIGGVRNWDYRFSWIRDASMTVQALLVLGHAPAARDFIEFASRAVRGEGERDPGVQIVFGLHGQTRLSEELLEDFEGWRGSRPVRIGNGAVTQWQHDVFGQLLSAADEFTERGGELHPDVWEFLGPVADEATRLWERTDYGIWEMQNGPAHFVHSKWMVAVALDRAIEMAEQRDLDGNVDRWRETRDAVREQVLERGWDAELEAFTLSYDTDALDAANLLIPFEGFLPPEDERVQATIDRTLEQLTENGLVYRYRADDGLPGEEGAFVACSFWLVDALALSGRTGEARDIFDRLARRASPLGLYSEEIDPETGAFLGNFPQAFSHIALINSAVQLARAEGREVPEAARHIGEHYDRS